MTNADTDKSRQIPTDPANSKKNANCLAFGLDLPPRRYLKFFPPKGQNLTSGALCRKNSAFLAFFLSQNVQNCLLGRLEYFEIIWIFFWSSLCAFDRLHGGCPPSWTSGTRTPYLPLYRTLLFCCVTFVGLSPRFLVIFPPSRALSTWTRPPFVLRES